MPGIGTGIIHRLGQDIRGQVHAVTTGSLGEIEGSIGHGDQFTGYHPVRRITRQTDAARYCDFLLLHLVGERNADPLRHHMRIVHVCVGQDDDELISAVAKGLVGIPDGALDHLGHLLQKNVARRMAVYIVVCLEAIQVEDKHGERCAVAAVPGKLLLHPLLKMPPVEQPGKLVDSCPLLGLRVKLRVLDRCGDLQGHLLQQSYLLCTKCITLPAGHNEGAYTLVLDLQRQIHYRAYSLLDVVLPCHKPLVSHQVGFIHHLLLPAYILGSRPGQWHSPVALPGRADVAGQCQDMKFVTINQGDSRPVEVKHVPQFIDETLEYQVDAHAGGDDHCQAVEQGYLPVLFL